MTYSKCDFIGHDSCPEIALQRCSVFQQTASVETRWWGQLICALLFWAIAAFYYWSIGRHGFSAPSRWLDLILYSMLGKWRQVWFWSFLGALFTFVGIWNLVVRILYGKSDDE